MGPTLQRTKSIGSFHIFRDSDHFFNMLSQSTLLLVFLLNNFRIAHTVGVSILRDLVSALQKHVPYPLLHCRQIPYLLSHQGSPTKTCLLVQKIKLKKKKKALASPQTFLSIFSSFFFDLFFNDYLNWAWKWKKSQTLSSTFLPRRQAVDGHSQPPIWLLGSPSWGVFICLSPSSQDKITASLRSLLPGRCMRGDGSCQRGRTLRSGCLFPCAIPPSSMTSLFG